MAETSGIAWTRSTFNPWIGCTKIGPGCDGCYAEALDKRMRYGGGTHWGAGVPRFRTSASNWSKPQVWNKQAPGSEFAGRRGFWPVFCASLADFCDHEAPAQWRIDLENLVASTPNLSWLLVTKRIGNIRTLYSRWAEHGFPDNVRVLITVVDQHEADRDIPKLLSLPCKNGISYEPALGGVDWRPWVRPQCDAGSIPAPDGVGGVMCPKCQGASITGCRGIEWLIVGGESSQPGHPARPFQLSWAGQAVHQCQINGVPVFVKQLGSDPHDGIMPRYLTKDRAGADPIEWPEELRVQEFPQ